MALAWCLDDESSRYADQVLERLREDEAMVPHHWALEVANGLLAAERRGRIRAAETVELRTMLLALPIVPDPLNRQRDLTSTIEAAREQDLTTYDAGYLELALRMAVPIATLDGVLTRAAERVGVGRWKP